MKISVSILSEIKNYNTAVEKLNETNADYLHLDIMDKTFTENTSFSFIESKEINNLSNKKLDVHIMSSDLENTLDEYISLNPDIISIHVEVDNIERYIEKIKENNIKVSLAINPDTNINKLYPYLDKIDLILVMSVVPGKGGQSFITSVIPKIKELRKLQDKYNYLIEVDGGINNDTIKYIYNYVDIVVSGSFITNKDNYQIAINELNNNL